MNEDKGDFLKDLVNSMTRKQVDVSNGLSFFGELIGKENVWMLRHGEKHKIKKFSGVDSADNGLIKLSWVEEKDGGEENKSQIMGTKMVFTKYELESGLVYEVSTSQGEVIQQFAVKNN